MRLIPEWCNSRYQMISVQIRSTTGRNQTRKTRLMLIRLIFNNIKTYEIKNFDPCILAQTLGVLFNRKLNLSMNEVLMNQITVTKLTIWENLPLGFRCMWSRHRLFPKWSILILHQKLCCLILRRSPIYVCVNHARCWWLGTGSEAQLLRLTIPILGWHPIILHHFL